MFVQLENSIRNTWVLTGLISIRRTSWFSKGRRISWLDDEHEPTFTSVSMDWIEIFFARLKSSARVSDIYVLLREHVTNAVKARSVVQGTKIVRFLARSTLRSEDRWGRREASDVSWLSGQTGVSAYSGRTPCCLDDLSCSPFHVGIGYSPTWKLLCVLRFLKVASLRNRTLSECLGRNISRSSLDDMKFFGFILFVFSFLYFSWFICFTSFCSLFSYSSILIPSSLVSLPSPSFKNGIHFCGRNKHHNLPTHRERSLKPCFPGLKGIIGDGQKENWWQPLNKPKDCSLLLSLRNSSVAKSG